MSFIGEINRIVGVERFGNALKYSIIDMGGQALYIEGISALLSVSDTEIRLSAGKTVITVSGELSLGSVDGECVVIYGTIRSVIKEAKA